MQKQDSPVASPLLQLGLALGLLEDGLHLGGLHDIALDLELARHEEALSVGLAGDEAGEVGVGQREGDCGRGRQNLTWVRATFGGG